MHARGRELTKERSPSTHEEVAVDALLLTRELIAGEVFVDKEGGRSGRINCKGRSLSKWEFATGGSTLCELLPRRASGALIPRRIVDAVSFGELQIKSGLRELRHLVVMSIERFFVRFRSFVVATGGSRM